MSIVKRHDIIQTSIMIKDRKQAIDEIEKDKGNYAEITDHEKNAILKDLHAREVQAVRQKANLAIDHQKLLKAEFNDTWTATIGAKQAILKVNKKMFAGKHLNLKFTSENGGETEGGETGGETGGEGEDGQVAYVTDINITPVTINGFQALKKKWQYFKINKVSIKFVSNSANNLSPIVCRYMPPMGKEGDLSKINIDYITKYAESVGTTSGYMSIHMPPCLVKKGTFDETNGFTYGTDGYCLPNLNKDRMLCSYEEDKFYLDYGTFILESKNIGTVQNIIAQIHYSIDFYSGYDYESASISGSGDDDGGEGGEGEEGTGDANHEGNSNIPDNLPEDDGLHPRGSYARSFKRTKK